jgi:hypothetical protein
LSIASPSSSSAVQSFGLRSGEELSTPFDRLPCLLGSMHAVKCQALGVLSQLYLFLPPSDLAQLFLLFPIWHRRFQPLTHGCRTVVRAFKGQHLKVSFNWRCTSCGQILVSHTSRPPASSELMSLFFIGCVVFDCALEKNNLP